MAVNRRHHNQQALSIGALASLLAHAALLVILFVVVTHSRSFEVQARHGVRLDVVARPSPQIKPLKRPVAPVAPKLKAPPKLDAAKKLPVPPAVVSRTKSAQAKRVAPSNKAKRSPSSGQPKIANLGLLTAGSKQHISHQFLRELEAAIRANLEYPVAAALQERQGTARVRVQMMRNGAILLLQLVHSSGTRSLDREATDVFRRIGTLPDMPADFRPDAAEFQFGVLINFRLQPPAHKR